ncbi:MAG: hypothetical protein COV35_01445 [Alphaproteobacteria bacterium CG11_big_fil_rev_8_21_14_0_20_39_49]|nr:MAG: hypothetical protein COV35_01445 [Alphaproteobacteria bacterium CG11_big_fil_rev_8_21_14_0_20_39_49]
MKLLYATLLPVLMCSASFEAKAIKASAVASVEIVEPTVFSQESGFETLSIDTSVSFFQKLFQKKNNGGKEEYVRQMPESEYRISGSTSNSIQISVASESTQESKVKIDDFVVSYSNGADNGDNNIVRSAPGRDAKLRLGATLRVNGDTQSGYHEPDFNIAIYYE